MRQFATFTLDEQVFGIDVLLVREINRHMDITPVQLAPDYVRGLINRGGGFLPSSRRLRGQIVTIFDLGVRLGLPPRSATRDSHNIILKTGDELTAISRREGRDELKSSRDTAGLFVDGIGDIVEEEAAIEAPPANVGDTRAQFLSGVVKLEDGLVHILDVQESLRQG